MHHLANSKTSFTLINDEILNYILNFQLIICGLGKIDVNDWKANTRLKHCTPDSNIVKWFWKAVEFFDEERRARLLQFVTGSSRVPLQGFKALQGNCSGSNCKCLYLEGAVGHIPETLAAKEAGWL